MVQVLWLIYLARTPIIKLVIFLSAGVLSLRLSILRGVWVVMRARFSFFFFLKRKHIFLE